MAFVVVYCETSGVVREAFRRRGHDAISVDLLPAQDGSNHHVICDMWEHADGLIRAGTLPDLAIFHNDCTYLTGSAEWAYSDGPYHMKLKPGTLVGAERRDAREVAIEGVRRVDRLPFPRKVLENPVGILSSRFRKPDQIVQPYEFGDNASKKTCLWLWNVPKLVSDAAKRFPGRWVEHPTGSGKMVERWSNQTDGGYNRLAPSDNRWQLRSDTFPGIAEAMAETFLEPVRDLFAAA